MARKQTEEKMPASAEPKIKPVRLDLDPELHRLLRLVAAHHDASMAAYAREALERNVRAEATRLGIKP
jgi:plasmid stability protein